MGGRIFKKRITFKYYSPFSTKVTVAGTFNGWNSEANPMKQDKEGNWSTVVDLFPGNYEYLFIIDDMWKNDPDCKMRIMNKYGGYNCVLIVD